jgi:hypothetical protein
MHMPMNIFYHFLYKSIYSQLYPKLEENLLGVNDFLKYILAILSSYLYAYIVILKCINIRRIFITKKGKFIINWRKKTYLSL